MSWVSRLTFFKKAMPPSHKIYIQNFDPCLSMFLFIMQQLQVFNQIVRGLPQSQPINVAFVSIYRHESALPTVMNLWSVFFNPLAVTTLPRKWNSRIFLNLRTKFNFMKHLLKPDFLWRFDVEISSSFLNVYFGPWGWFNTKASCVWIPWWPSYPMLGFQLEFSALGGIRKTWGWVGTVPFWGRTWSGDYMQNIARMFYEYKVSLFCHR